MGKKDNKTIVAAWIGFSAVVIAAIIGAFVMLSQDSKPSISVEVKDGQGIVTTGNQSPVSVNQTIIQDKKRIAVVDVLSSVDLHLGDNVYPDRYGFSHNPLNQDVYKQGVRGIIYFDKKTGDFLSDQDRPTIIGQALVNFMQTKFQNLDFSSYEWVRGFSPQDSGYNQIISSNKGQKTLLMLGPTALVAKDAKWGNFYERYAAIGIARSINFVSECERQGIKLNDSNNLNVKIVIHSYHGGIREGQTENFELQFNDYRFSIPSKTRRMRDAQEISIPIPNKYINFNRENLLYVYVLPWEEELPQITKNGVSLKPTHFRDVGIIYLAVKLESKV